MRPSDLICYFKEANNAIGALVHNFKTVEELEHAIPNSVNG